MSERKIEMINWIKKNKKAVILTTIAATAAIVMLLTKDKTDKELLCELNGVDKMNPFEYPEKRNLEQDDILTIEDHITTRLYTSPQEAFDVSQHIRVLPEGKHHSAEKAAEAEALGIILLPNQTLVDAYTKNSA